MLTDNNTKILTGSRVIIESLKSLGVDTIFGYPGGIVLGLYDELYKQNDIKHVLVRHEQSAVHAAEGYARTTGKCGVVLVTSGPGATNTVTGIANAYMDGSPLIVLTGQVFKNLIGKDAFQEANICDITRSCTKAVYQIDDAKNIQSVLQEAYTCAMSGKKGPVVVDLVKDIFDGKAEFNQVITEIQDSSIINYSEVERIAGLLKQSSRPVIVAGGGVNHSKCYKELWNFAQKFSIPVVSTMMGLGSYPQEDKNYLGMVGIFGDNCANEVIRQSDLIISLGARFNDRITCMYKDVDLSSKLVQIDINQNEIGRMISPRDYMVCDIKQFLRALDSKTAGMNKDWKSWLFVAQDYRNLNKKREKTSNMLHSFEVMKKIDEYTKDKNVIFTSEVGQHQLWAVQNLHVNQDRKLLLSGGSGTMGFGLPAAIGACVGSPDSEVVCISGDGSFQMSIGELATCKDYNLNLKIMILNNGYLGMVRQLQQKNCEGRYSQTKISNPDFVELAHSYGIKAVKVNSINDIDNALERAFSQQGPYIIDFSIEPMEVL